MLKKYLIVLNDPITNEQFEQLSKIISANYVSINAGINLFLIADNGENAQIVYENLNKKLNDTIAFIVIDLEFYYGNLPDEVFDWLEEKFPSDKLIRDSKNLK